MQGNSRWVFGSLATLLFVASAKLAVAQINVNAAADTAESAALRGSGQFLHGLGWYDLSTAKAASINADTQIRWARELRRVQAERRSEELKKATGNRLKQAEIKERQKTKELQLRVEPTPDDVRKGEALNVLLYDLMDPRISAEQWQANPIPLPDELSLKDLVFKFVSASGSSQSISGVVALSRLEVAKNWPTAMNLNELSSDKSACEEAFETVRKQVFEGNLNPESIVRLNSSLTSLQKRVSTVVPVEQGFRGEAILFVSDLREATRMFDGHKVDYAKEMLVETKEYDATTVAELVAFTLKYRLQFASSERSPTAQRLYPQLFDLMSKQVKSFSISPEEAPEARVSADLIVQKYSDGCNKARKKLLDSMDKKIAMTKNDQSKLLSEEKAFCVKNNSMPFSPSMRADAKVYLQQLDEAKKTALESLKKLSYEDFIYGKSRIGPVQVGRWQFSDPKDPKFRFTRTLNSDKTIREVPMGTWTLDDASMVLTSPNPKAPGGAWKDSCAVGKSGLKLSMQNQQKHKFIADRTK